MRERGGETQIRDAITTGANHEAWRWVDTAEVVEEGSGFYVNTLWNYAVAKSGMRARVDLIFDENRRAERSREAEKQRRETKPS
jgi:hypothetical protein